MRRPPLKRRFVQNGDAAGRGTVDPQVGRARHLHGFHLVTHKAEFINKHLEVGVVAADQHMVEGQELALLVAPRVEPECRERHGYLMPLTVEGVDVLLGRPQPDDIPVAVRLEQPQVHGSSGSSAVHPEPQPESGRLRRHGQRPPDVAPVVARVGVAEVKTRAFAPGGLQGDRRRIAAVLVGGPGIHIVEGVDQRVGAEHGRRQQQAERGERNRGDLGHGVGLRGRVRRGRSAATNFAPTDDGPFLAAYIQRARPQPFPVAAARGGGIANLTVLDRSRGGLRLRSGLPDTALDRPMLQSLCTSACQGLLRPEAPRGDRHEASTALAAELTRRQRRQWTHLLS